MEAASKNPRFSNPCDAAAIKCAADPTRSSSSSRLPPHPPPPRWRLTFRNCSLSPPLPPHPPPPWICHLTFRNCSLSPPPTSASPTHAPTAAIGSAASSTLLPALGRSASFSRMPLRERLSHPPSSRPLQPLLPTIAATALPLPPPPPPSFDPAEAFRSPTVAPPVSQQSPNPRPFYLFIA